MAITASARMAGISGLRPSPSAQRSQKPPACSTWRPCAASLLRSVRRSTFGPRKPSMAGSRVSDAAMVSPTTSVTTTTLFAALDILEGKVIGRCMQRHRHQEFIRFLNAVEREVAADTAVDVVLDDYATHKHPRVKAWLPRHARFTFDFTPTSRSWANAVEGWFAKLTRQRLKRGVFTSIVELQTAINRFIADANAKPKPFVWTKSADAILAAVDRGRQALEAIHQFPGIHITLALSGKGAQHLGRRRRQPFAPQGEPLGRCRGCCRHLTGGIQSFSRRRHETVGFRHVTGVA